MKIFDNEADIKKEDIELYGFDPVSTVFFDIETTGFSPAHCKLYMIGCLFMKDDTFYTRQFFLDNCEDEELLIKAFFMFIKDFKTIIHFNGEGFDIPFILNKCIAYNLPYDFSKLKSVDLYKETVFYKNLFKLENHKQKTLERFLGLNREDEYSGGELINIYKDYMTSGDSEKLSLLLLHNAEDIKGLLTLLKLYSYKMIFNGDFTVDAIEVSDYISMTGEEKKEAVITMTSDIALPERISIGYKSFYLTAYSHSIKIKISIYSGELKFFYPNYKDYYYLPMEDTAIHKSVSFYVDKNYRTKAKAANCYSKKTGLFVPQYNEIVSPYFKIIYNDHVTYFELTPEVLENKELMKSYSLHIIDILCKKLPV